MSQYAVPEGFEWDEASGKYINIQILSDESGVKYRRIVSFDANSGTYDQQLTPISDQPKRQKPAPPPLPQTNRNFSSVSKPMRDTKNFANSSSRAKVAKSTRPQKRKSKRRLVRGGRRKKPVWFVPTIIAASILLVGIGAYLGYRKLKVDALGYGMMMNDEEVVKLLDMDSFEEHVESFYGYDGDFIEEGIVK